MADLRDQLLRAGLVDKKTKQQADTAARKNRKKKKKKKKKKENRTDGEAARQREAYDARIAAEAEENRRRAAQRNQEQAEQERKNQVANLAGTQALRQLKPGPRRFCFVSRERKIQWFDLNADLAQKLEQGRLAIVERPGDEDEPYALVPANIAERIEELDPEAVRFWNREPAEPTR